MPLVTRGWGCINCIYDDNIEEGLQAGIILGFWDSVENFGILGKFGILWEISGLGFCVKL